MKQMLILATLIAFIAFDAFAETQCFETENTRVGCWTKKKRINLPKGSTVCFKVKKKIKGRRIKSRPAWAFDKKGNRRKCKVKWRGPWRLTSNAMSPDLAQRRLVEKSDPEGFGGSAKIDDCPHLSASDTVAINNRKQFTGEKLKNISEVIQALPQSEIDRESKKGKMHLTVFFFDFGSNVKCYGKSMKGKCLVLQSGRGLPRCVRNELAWPIPFPDFRAGYKKYIDWMRAEMRSRSKQIQKRRGFR